MALNATNLLPYRVRLCSIQLQDPNHTTSVILFVLTAEGGDRETIMETRLVVAEQSNRALLDEVLRLQGQLQSAVRASQDALAAERKSRDQLESVLIR